MTCITGGLVNFLTRIEFERGAGFGVRSGSLCQKQALKPCGYTNQENEFQFHCRLIYEEFIIEPNCPRRIHLPPEREKRELFDVRNWMSDIMRARITPNSLASAGFWNSQAGDRSMRCVGKKFQPDAKTVGHV